VQDANYANFLILSTIDLVKHVMMLFVKIVYRNMLTVLIHIEQKIINTLCCILFAMFVYINILKLK